MEILKEKIPMTEDIKYILRTLQENGKGYIVGGYVRDNLLGLEPNDCDFCTTVGQLYLMDIFKLYQPTSIHTRLKVTQINYNKEQYQITGMQYNEDILEDEKIYQDLERRDLTINAIAFDGEKFYAAPYAFEDLENRVIRFIGNPVKTVIEDPIRILRAMRIYVVKDFDTIEENSYTAMKKYRYLLLKVGKRQIKKEIEKMFLLGNRDKALKLLEEMKLTKFLPTEKSEQVTKKPVISDSSISDIVKTASLVYSAYEQYMENLRALKAENIVTALLSNRGCSLKIIRKVLVFLRGQYDFFRLHFRKASLAEAELKAFMRKAGYPESVYNKVTAILNEQEELENILSEKKIRKLINRTGAEHLPELFSFVREIYKTNTKDVSEKYVNSAIETIIKISQNKDTPKKKKKKKEVLYE